MYIFRFSFRSYWIGFTCIFLTRSFAFIFCDVTELGQHFIDHWGQHTLQVPAISYHFYCIFWFVFFDLHHTPLWKSSWIIYVYFIYPKNIASLIHCTFRYEILLSQEKSMLYAYVCFKCGTIYMFLYNHAIKTTWTVVFSKVF